MNYEEFLSSLEINRTDLGKGKGVRCKIALYLYPDGHGNIYCLNEQGKTKDVGTPANNSEETLETLKDILNEMGKRSKLLLAEKG